MTEKLLRLFQTHVKSQHELDLYPYQLEVAEKIFDALIQNLRLTADAQIEFIKKLQTIEIPVEFARQSGKTTDIVHIIEFILEYFTQAFHRPIKIGLTAPQDKQTKIDFDRLKAALRKTEPKLIITDLEQQQIAKEESNAHNLVLPNGSGVAVFSMSSISKIEGQSFDIIFVEEAQDANDIIMLQSVFPMGATTNAPRILIGTAGTQICYFLRLVQKPDALIYKWDSICKQRRQTYEETGDARHLIYEQYVRSEMAKYGEESDEFQRPYNLKWLIGTGQFVTQEALAALETDRRPTQQYKKSPVYVGIDVAKHPDSTVVTFLRYNKDIKKKEVLYWMELRGENYQDQFDIIKYTLQNNFSVVAIAIDSTGVGDPFSDLFVKNTEWQDENSGLYAVKFTAVSKDNMYRNLKLSITELLTTLPNLGTKQGEKFKQQMLDLQQEYKGQLLSVKHPDSNEAHDDYCFPAGTLIRTENGNIPIQQLLLGTKVWTRDGYKPILKISCREAETIKRFGFTATPNHPFITEQGVKRFDELHESDKLYIWNEKQSNIKAKSITVIQSQQKDISEFTIGGTTNGKSHLSHYTDKFISTTSAIFQKVTLSITKTATLSTITRPTWRLCQEESINQTIKHQRNENKQERTWRSTQDRKQKHGTAQQRGWSGIGNTLKRVFSNARTVLGTTKGNSYQTVYNLTVAEQPEYLANNILVHNCDSWALAEWAYAKYNENQADVQVVDMVYAKERKVERDVRGKVIEYWPESD